MFSRELVPVKHVDEKWIELKTLAKESIFWQNICHMATKRTYQPKKKRRARVHGFLKRMRTRAGREVLSRRRRKGRKAISVTSRRNKSKR